jgi:hypothetical protein
VEQARVDGQVGEQHSGVMFDSEDRAPAGADDGEGEGGEEAFDEEAADAAAADAASELEPVGVAPLPFAKDIGAQVLMCKKMVRKATSFLSSKSYSKLDLQEQRSLVSQLEKSTLLLRYLNRRMSEPGEGKIMSSGNVCDTPTEGSVLPFTFTFVFYSDMHRHNSFFSVRSPEGSHLRRDVHL